MKMKKIAAIVFSAAMVLNMGAAVFAEASEIKSFTKSYTVNGGDAIPAEKLQFTVTADAGNPDSSMMIGISDTDITGNPQSIDFILPGYQKVGKYNYTVTEVAGNTQGVTYSQESFNVQVLVTNDADGDNKLDTQISFTTMGTDQKKISGIVNNYDLGSLTVRKKVAGNLASSTQKFDIDVTFTVAEGKEVKSAISYGGAGTIAASDWKEDGTVTRTISIANDEDITFSNIPAGVTYTVTEQAKHTEDDDANFSDGSKGYTVTYENGNGTIAVGTANAVVTNTKGTTVDTGINLDNMPYIMMLALVAVCAVVLFVRKRFSANR